MTTTKNEILLLSAPSSPDSAAKSHSGAGAVAADAGAMEFQLGSSGWDFVSEDVVPTPASSEISDLTQVPDSVATKSGALGLPLTLCDEDLLEEINSIPDRMGFKIGEVAELLGIKNYVLRYWESEFEILKPKKSSSNQRIYTRKDVENAFIIRKLLHRDRFSVEGAKMALRDLKTQVRKEVNVQKTFEKIDLKIETFHGRVESLLNDVRKLRKALT